MLAVIYFVRMPGLKHKITLQTGNGEEFRGKSEDNLEYLNKQIFGSFSARLIHIPKGRKELNAFVEKSHQTDGNEFYIELCHDLKNSSGEQ